MKLARKITKKLSIIPDKNQNIFIIFVETFEGL